MLRKIQVPFGVNVGLEYVLVVRVMVVEFRDRVVIVMAMVYVIVFMARVVVLMIVNVHMLAESIVAMRLVLDGIYANI